MEDRGLLGEWRLKGRLVDSNEGGNGLLMDDGCGCVWLKSTREPGPESEESDESLDSPVKSTVSTMLGGCDR